jgi:cell division protein FtsB
VSATHSVNAPHRNRWMLPLALVVAAIMMVGWFPASSLWHQQAQLNSTANEIKAVQRQEAILTNERKTDDTKAAATQLARAQYQLVNPGQSLIQVLPGDSNGQVSANSVDPGFQSLVSPSSAAPGTATSSASTSTTHRSSKGFVSRLERTLEFWR